MGNLDKLNKIEAICLILVIITNQIILNLSNSILVSTGSAAPLNTIYISIIAIIFTFIICKLFKKFINKDLLDISYYLGGNVLKIIISMLYMVFFTFITSILLRYFGETLKSIYFQNIPIVFILLVFLIPPILINHFGLNAISKIVLLFIPTLLISFVFLIYTTLKNFDTSQIFPVLGYGANKTFFLGLSNLFAFGGLAYIYFLNPLLKKPQDFKKISVLSIAISSLFLILSVTSLLMLLPFIVSSNETLSIYLLTKTVELGRFIQRIEAVFIFFWIFSTLCYISVNIFYVLNIFQKTAKIQNSKAITYALSAIIFSLALLPKNIAQIKFLEESLYKYFTIILVFGISFFILLFANIKRKRKDLASNE